MDTGHVMTTEDSEPSPTELEPSSLARLVVVSNRIGSRSVQTGGLATALQGALEEHGGQWFGWSGRVLDEGEPARVATTPGHVRYTTLDLHRSEYQGFYCNFANRVLWPLFHFRPDLVDYSRADYEAYLAVNQRFAELLIPTLQPDDTLWIHDYHLIPLAGLLRQAEVTQRTGLSLHTPPAPPDLLPNPPAPRLSPDSPGRPATSGRGHPAHRLFSSHPPGARGAAGHAAQPRAAVWLSPALRSGGVAAPQ